MLMPARITPLLIVYVHAQQQPIRFFKLPTEWPRYVETLNKARDDELTCFESWHLALIEPHGPCHNRTQAMTLTYFSYRPKPFVERTIGCAL